MQKVKIIHIEVLSNSNKKIKIKSYADNFKYNRNKSDID